MDSKTSRAKYLKVAILIISVCFILGAISACLPFNMSVPALDNNAISNTIATITQNSSDGLGEFNDGYTYVYTDRTKIDKYRAGDESTPYDITTVKVDKTNNARGTQKNPYVISTTSDWETFVKMCGVNLANSNGKYFVLANDIDFSGETFHPVGKFGGTFYGMGNKLLNITCNTWQYYNGSSYVTVGTTGQTNSGFGPFCSTTNAIFTDLIVEDFSMGSIPNTVVSGVSSSGVTSSSGYGPYIGGIVGITFGSNVFLNCQTSGEIVGGTSYSAIYMAGGLVGTNTISGSNRAIYFYRCSSNLTGTTIRSSTSVMIGGLLAQSWGGVTALDCAGNVYATVTASGALTGSIFGWSENSTDPFVFENLVGKTDIDGTANGDYSAVGGLRGTTTCKISNTYAEGTVGTTTKTSMYSYVWYNTTPSSGFTNINVVKASASYKGYQTGRYDGLSKITGEPTEYATSSTMLVKAKDFFSASPYSRIWDTSLIGTDYAPDNSPIRNYLMAYVNFRNLTNGGNDEESVGLPDGDPYIMGDKLPDETSDVSAFITYLNNKKSANHIFIGWTDDPTGESEPFMELPQGLFGDVTLYAVWTLPDSYIAGKVTTNLTSDKATIEYDSVEAITLTASVNHSFTIMTNPSTKYHFLQDGENKATDDEEVKTSGKLSVKTVADTGTYTFTYRVVDGLEPLWRYDGKPTDSVDIEIEKGKLANMSVDDFNISSATVPYYGKKYENIDFTVKLFNRSDIEVELANMEWQSTLGKVDVKGTNTRNIIVSPVDTNNYETQYVFSVSFESQSLVMIFNLEQIHKTIEVEVEYGQNYGANEIIYLFEQAYLKALSTWDADTVKDVSSMAPYLDGKSLSDNDANADKYDTEYNGIDKIHTIQVTFKDASYEVVFNPNNGGGS
ncbi:MAG: hypothetical protein K2O86_03460, partial [Clostridia bacterium]|nr:hypothetical protein [Clostridia bacterium]